ncbi:4-hydroxythreonine-4-phosphate dehydrogenase [uncultured Paludibacter sp.]|uniref:4-hydroxythreonine-4-phosphate dehydrogenase n=1 Tax=uncultured Paludibacter sp. TaxID=497635 RepID=A0A653AJ37_9BACT|nr:4-hydroxythreonine-4-phosphate dehydrogenase [uncultured Paludibacter sp.]
MENDKIIIGITHGDINGIGYEVILKALADTRILDLFVPVIYGSSKIAAYHRKNLDLPTLNLNAVNSVKEISSKRVNIISCVDENVKVEIGQSTEEAGKAALESLKKATEDLKKGLIHAIVTAPINKKNIQSEIFHFPGHTEYLEEKFGDENSSSLMMLVNDVVRVAVVTGHIPVNKISENITDELILKKLRILNKSLKEDFAIVRPRIAVLGLNPHAGDEGVIGDEEQKTIIPALKKADEEGILCFGPYPADGFFGSGSFKKFDAVLAMYHDQGLIPFKVIAMENGVNFTAGLPIIRTSPAHGTAYDLAGQNKASEVSFLNAIYLACDVHKNRLIYKEITANPLVSEKRNEGNNRVV